MATYNSMPGLSTDASSNDGISMNMGQVHHHNIPMDVFDQDMGFDESLLDETALQNLPFGPPYDMDPFSATFEDPFSYSSHNYQPSPSQCVPPEESSPQEPDKKLLGFCAPVATTTMIDETGQFIEANITSELHGMFFVAEDVFGGESTGRPLELTCYRRNLWQCMAQITVPRVLSNIVTDQGQQLRISSLVAVITAFESIDRKQAGIISVPGKNGSGPIGECSKSTGSPPSITLDLSCGQELDNGLVSVPISWKRLQFKHATANNGRRKGLQQHYVVSITLYGRMDEGTLLKISEIQSGPVIVRGRSPRNFDGRKDVVVTGERRLERRSTSNANLEQPLPKLEQENSQSQVQTAPPQSMNDWMNQHIPQPSPQIQNSHPAKRIAVSPIMNRPPIPAWSRNSSNSTQPPFNHNSKNSVPRQLPINLSLSEDERSPNPSSTDIHSPNSGRGNTVAVAKENSPSEEADPLYEYFPLTVDDWMPPVDAVYRPHVVHHTVIQPEMKAQQLRSKTKRYFASE